MSKLDIAIDRWRRSKGSRARYIDSLIELRIALEALYVDEDRSGRLKLKIAITGAWHLGETYDQREEIFNSYKDLYDLASKVIHAKNIDGLNGLSEDKWIEKREILIQAQDLCRQGILKQIREDEKPKKWKDLILGREVHT